MDDQARSEIIKDNPIGKGLDAFRSSFKVVCENQAIPSTLDSLGKLGRIELQNIALVLFSRLQILPAARLLRSNGGRTLFSELPRLNSAITSDDFDFDRIKPLLSAVIIDKPDNEIWVQVYVAVTEFTPSPRPIASSVQQTPWLHNTGSFANSSEYRQDVDRILKLELGPLYVGLPGFHETFFGRVADLEAASEAFFKKCMEGSDPLFQEGWKGWPQDANQNGVLSWIADFSEKLMAFAEGYESIPKRRWRRRPLAQPNKPIQGSTAERKLDVGFVNNPKAGKYTICRWEQIFVPGELKSNPSADTASKAWLDLGWYAREVLTAQNTRRFVLGFTLCGSLMRVWLFDRLGGIASDHFDINEEGLQFVSTILGFLWMNEEELGFDSTIITANGQRFIEIKRKSQTECLIIDAVMKRAPCVAGRATTCWKAHRKDDLRTPLVIKDSWQFTERDEEGELLRKATNSGVINVARYYHHETVYVRGEVDDIRENVRGELNIMEARNYRPGRLALSRGTSASASWKGRSSSKAGLKRSSSQANTHLPPSKRSCSESLTKADSRSLQNRVHRRVILRDYGKPIYKASSPAALLGALEGCIEGHESLRKAGLLHRDISINNLMINEDKENPSWPSFLIDLDLAIKEEREVASGARGKTGTRAFMAIGVLLDEPHSFMHDLESFFWVLFWICIHYNGPGKDIGSTEFENWNYESDNNLVRLKIGTIGDESVFLRIADESFTSFYQQLIPWVNRLRMIVFPNGERWRKLNPDLYSEMKNLLRKAREDVKVIAER